MTINKLYSSYTLKPELPDSQPPQTVFEPKGAPAHQ
ncbi:predicted protein [Sclerotinia sclerotiorum 1980 UF-70]|uniref:Uncharacterized protein n=1 Tax=Sclerotinia sclerotiorum (strain ATCC 18683 / 1980 / Ss-1) TaxID=665079 RepID=A7EYF9_SCLS1|nr:predicted protein [Sclerotinia sclerotiorum 1980 UF-70]EDN94501.1 predicted protein [Sclerotinia sclerotiorum 1980 UF-70]